MLNKKNGALFLMAFVAVVGLRLGQFQESRADGEPVVGRFFATYYYLTMEDRYAGHAQVPMYDLSRNFIAMVDSGFKNNVTIQGSGRLSDGRIVHYTGGSLYGVSNDRYAVGGMNCELIPFHAIAVDPRQIPLGSLLRIDETIGMALPDGTTHNGLWAAVDTGGAIQGRHIDLYIGDGSDQNEQTYLAGMQNRQNVTVRLVSRSSGGCPQVE